MMSIGLSSFPPVARAGRCEACSSLSRARLSLQRISGLKLVRRLLRMAERLFSVTTAHQLWEQKVSPGRVLCPESHFSSDQEGAGAGSDLRQGRIDLGNLPCAMPRPSSSDTASV